eukprot:gene11522-11665_t
MAHPAGPFLKALAMFQMRICAANIRYDATVPYCTAAMCMHNPYDDVLPVPRDPKYPSVVRPAAGDEQVQPVQYRGRYRLLLLLVFLPLFPAFYLYTITSGVLHHRKARRLPLDLTWLEQQAAGLGGEMGELGLLNAHHKSEAELARLEKLGSLQLEHEAQLHDPSDTGELAAQPTAAMATAAETTEIQDHEGIVATPWLLHQQQEWMAKHLNDDMPPSGRRHTSSSGGTRSPGWHRIDVCTGHFHAHAAVIIRDKRFESQSRDLFEYIGYLIAL